MAITSISSQRLARMSAVDLRAYIMGKGDAHLKKDFDYRFTEGLDGMSSSAMVGNTKVCFTFDEVVLRGTRYFIYESDKKSTHTLETCLTNLCLDVALFNVSNKMLTTLRCLVIGGKPYTVARLQSEDVTFIQTYLGKEYKVTLTQSEERQLLLWADLKLKAVAKNLQACKDFDRNNFLNIGALNAINSRTT